MDLNKVKNLIRRNGDKVFLVENGEPQMVVMSFEEYEMMAAQNGSEGGTQSHQAINPTYPNRAKIADLSGEKLKETEFILPVDGGMSSMGVHLEDIRLEDLPI